MYRRVSPIARMMAVLAAQLALLVSGCAREPQRTEPLHDRAHKFDIYWPPVDPETAKTGVRRPLLRGNVAIKEAIATGEDCALEIAVTITRPSTENDREFWNSQLEFANLPWMDEVRVWDSESKWQWPNLPFLLRRSGVERVERYGGVDPGKGVDNDFAAVVIRKFDADGNVESQSTRDAPLVSAEWCAEGEQATDVHSLVHVARSDTFTVHVGKSSEHSAGKLKLWLIYADFLGARPPASWPKKGEWAGGVLAYCEVDWDKRPNQYCCGTARFLRPESDTGFDWIAWTEDPAAPAPPRLTDSPE